MKLTLNFIFVVFGITVIFDIIAVIIQNKKEGKKLGWVTITSIFRRWFKEKPLVPFMIGGVFIGHFGVYEWNKLLVEKTSIIIFLILASLITVWFIIEMILTKLKKDNSKVYLICCRLWPMPMTAGILVGSFWQ